MISANFPVFNEGIATHYCGIPDGFGIEKFTEITSIFFKFFTGSQSADAIFILSQVQISINGFTIVILADQVIRRESEYGVASEKKRTAGRSVIRNIYSLGLIVVKLFAHCRWIITTAWKMFARPARQVFTAAQSPAVVFSQNRRDFLKLAGVVGAAALLATGVTVKSQMGQGASPETQIALAGGDSPATGVSSSSAASEISGPVIASSTARSATPAAAAASTSAPSSCRVVCNRGCSYPGRCRRYVDTNGNGLCDNGECMG